MAKRNQRKSENLKKQQHRRGSFDSLLAGNGFGRNARSDPNILPDFSNFQVIPSNNVRNNIGQNHQGQEIEKRISHGLFEAMLKCIYLGHCEHINYLLRVYRGNEGKSSISPSNASMNRGDNIVGDGYGDDIEYNGRETSIYGINNGHFENQLPYLHNHYVKTIN